MDAVWNGRTAPDSCVLKKFSEDFFTCKMAKSGCLVCKRRVTSVTGGIACEKCREWYHVACVFGVLQVSMDLLNHKNLVFLCDGCVSLDEEDKVDSSTQTDDEVRTTTTTQTQTDEVRTTTTQTDEVRTTTTETKTQDKEEGGQPEVVAVAAGEGGTTAVPKRVEMVKRSPIRIIGDSMVRHTPAHVKCSLPGSGCTSLPGARIFDVKEKVKEVASKMEDGLLIIQGGGNDLKKIGVEETVKEVVDAVKAAERKKMSVAVVGVLRRPREDVTYERMRRATNKRIFEEVTRMKVKWMKEKSGNVSFLDLDRTLDDDRLFARDGVHLTVDGNARMGRRLREWVKARSVCCVDGA